MIDMKNRIIDPNDSKLLNYFIVMDSSGYVYKVNDFILVFSEKEYAELFREACLDQLDPNYVIVPFMVSTTKNYVFLLADGLGVCNKIKCPKEYYNDRANIEVVSDLYEMEIEHESDSIFNPSYITTVCFYDFFNKEIFLRSKFLENNSAVFTCESSEEFEVAVKSLKKRYEKERMKYIVFDVTNYNKNRGPLFKFMTDYDIRLELNLFARLNGASIIFVTGNDESDSFLYYSNTIIYCDQNRMYMLMKHRELEIDQFLVMRNCGLCLPKSKEKEE